MKIRPILGVTHLNHLDAEPDGDRAGDDDEDQGEE